MDSMKIKEMNCDEDNHLTPPIQSVTVDTICNFGPLAGPHGIGKRKFMITDILNTTNKNTPTQSGSPNNNIREPLHPHTANSYSGSAFQSLVTSTNAMNTGSSPTTNPAHFNLGPHHPAAAAAAMAAIGAAGTDLRMYSNFLPAAALQQIQQHREQLILNHQRATSDNGELDDTTGTNSNDVDIEEDNGGDSEG